eukprot:CAMPEP_0184874220 /NCGR_PEP_ID=MMETSP0580-20130426/42270_1 /TAXON_ID=1118495 /ORGANISM="Dactyliosolen fragilissimus" /LENGTH=131 /DNA_ID=CAMNT_0027377201 /DNA_START=581 /DNA_END=972 /DNA_ORIENTATION=-
MMKWRTLDDGENKNGVVDVIKCFKKNFSDEFFNVTKAKGYCSGVAPTITATFWIAMSDAAGLRVTQQRIIKRYLCYHLGDRVAVSEVEIRKVGSNYVSFETDTIHVDEKEYGVKDILVHWRGLDDVINNYG